ncbi:helix-turn-helix domain-containing protein [Streptomyces sp. SID8382]|uniref:helix-turn-helix domain-containing protein n=1 Tax=Streptomyces malaysiensis TaxID=92644 RepID=UPI000C2BF475|nr:MULTISPECIES: helix-turn-helix domain-containing protein [unclassified Streptomyces]AUA13772.1 Transcriptional activator NphR [Streptomyces sp. M56]MYX56342.1 helix-turn-helix domain-containing protein [Streptomyces sp. SID8382]
MRFVRTPRLIRQSDPELYHLTLLHTGSVAIGQSGLANVHGPGGMYFIDCSRPFACRMGGRFTGIGLEIPKALIPLLVADLVTRSLTEHQGIGSLLVGFLTQLSACEASYRAQDMTRLETVLVDLFSTVLAHHLDRENSLPAETTRRTLLMRIRSFIRRHLHDSDLTPAAIAAAHHISVSHLHRVFQTAQGTTVSAHIRGLRLEGARGDLADPAQRAASIGYIATRWGFTHHASFTRAFHGRYHMTPTDYRHISLDTEDGP